MNYLKLRKLLWLLSAVFFIGCQTEHTETSDENSIIGTESPLENNAELTDTLDHFSFSTIESENGWGYDIFNNGDLYIHQPHIPAISGIQGFFSEEDAAECAQLAIHKIENGIVPPTLSRTEMDSLGIRLPQ